MGDKKNPKKGILTSSLYAGVCGVGLDFIAPMFMDGEHDHGIAVVLKVVGILGATYYAMTWSKFDRLFINMGLGIDNVYPIQKNMKKNPKSTYYKFTLPTGMSVKQFDDKKENIEQHFGKKIEISYLNHGLFGIEMFHNTTAEMYDYDDEIKVDGKVAFPMGYDMHEKLITCDLSKLDNNTNMLIAGSVGGGKSILLKVILTYLITKKQVDMYLIDLKGTELIIYEKCGCVKTVCYEADKVYELLVEIRTIMKKRYATFRKHGVRDIKAYNEKFKKSPMKHIVLAIDEFAELMEDDKSQSELELISSQGRASGLSIIISTQRPDAKVISSRIKAMMCVVAGLRTNTDINSRIIMDNDSLTKLRGNGHCMFRYGIKDTELQGMFISDSQIERLIQPFEVEKPKVVDQPVNKNETIDIDYADLEVYQQ